LQSNDLIKLGIGEKVLNKENLTDSRVNKLNNILDTIGYFKKNNGDRDSEGNRYNNFISILGSRGSGKSSMILTIIDELKKEIEREAKNNNYVIQHDLILEKIDPLMFSLEKNALGWIISMFEERVEKLKKMKNNSYCCEINNAIDRLEKSYTNISKNYIISRDFYRNNLHALSEGINEYKNVNKEIIKADLKLEKSFKDFIDNFVCVAKSINKTGQEPYIVISFDDIDIRPQYGPEILDTIISHLSHKNIIVLISGDYNTFKESLFIDIWRKQDAPEDIKINEVLVEDTLKETILQRAEDILNKVMPSSYRVYLDGLSISERLTFTPYGYNGETIAELLSKLKIQTKLAKYNMDENSILEYFITPIIGTKGLDKEIARLDAIESKRHQDKKIRGYDGYKYDRGFYEENIKSKKAISELMELYSNKKTEGNDEQNRFLVKQYNTREKMILDNVSYVDLAELLPETPRGLINLYHSLYEFIKYIDDGYIVKAPSNNSSYYGENRIIHIYNFEKLITLFDIFRQSNIRLNYQENKKILEEVIEIDKEYKTISFNFKNIMIGSKEFYHNKIINTTSSLTFSKTSKLTKVRISNEVARYIEFIYDLSKNYLLKDYVNLKQDKQISGITIYNRSEENIRVETDDFCTFRDFHIFEAMYKISLPMIIQDLKVHRNIRERLRLYLYNIMVSTLNKKVENGGGYLYYSKLNRLRDLVSNSNDKYVDDYISIYEEYYERYYIENSSETRTRNYSVSEFILNYKEDNKFIFGLDYDFIRNNETLLLYNSICLNLTSTKSYKTRIYELAEILNSSSDIIKGTVEGKLREKLVNLIDEIEDESNTDEIGAIIDKRWSDIANDIVRLLVYFVAHIIIKNYDLLNNDNADLINKENKNLLLKLKEIKSIKIDRSILINLFNELTGTSIDNKSIEKIDMLSIYRFIARYDYTELDNNLLSKYLQELQKGVTGKNNIIRHLVELKDILEESYHNYSNLPKNTKLEASLISIQVDISDVNKIIKILDRTHGKQIIAKLSDVIKIYSEYPPNLDSLINNEQIKIDEVVGDLHE
jgi:hypothetical protein